MGLTTTPRVGRERAHAHAPLDGPSRGPPRSRFSLLTGGATRCRQVRLPAPAF